MQKLPLSMISGTLLSAMLLGYSNTGSGCVFSSLKEKIPCDLVSALVILNILNICELFAENKKHCQENRHRILNINEKIKAGSGQFPEGLILTLNEKFVSVYMRVGCGYDPVFI